MRWTATPAAEPGDGSAQEPDGAGAGLLVEDLDVGEAGGVIDRDVDEPADPAAAGVRRSPLTRWPGQPICPIWPIFLMSLWIGSPGWRCL